MQSSDSEFNQAVQIVDNFLLVIMILHNYSLNIFLPFFSLFVMKTSMLEDVVVTLSAHPFRSEVSDEETEHQPYFQGLQPGWLHQTSYPF